MSDLDLRALSVKCPLCSASPQKPCFDTGRIGRVGVNIHAVPHVARIDAYIRLQLKEKGTRPWTQSA